MKGYARSAACLLAMLAVASCTADGLMPPADIGTSQAVTPGSNTLTAAPAVPAVSQPGAESTAPLASAATPAFSGTEPSAGMPQGDGGPIAAVAAMSTIQLAPITGATEEALAPLRQRLAARARERGIGVAGQGALPTHILRGYLSEVADANSTTVIYVWDVVDPSGTRLHRIQGTAKIKGADGWSAVSASTMQAIADRTIDDLAQWLAGRTG